MIIDCQTHVWKHPGHMPKELLLEMSGSTDDQLEGWFEFNVDLNDHLEAAEQVDVSLVSAFRSRHLGVEVPNEYVMDYVNNHPDRLLGIAAVDPYDPDPAAELRNAVEELGMKGVALSPTYQNFHPSDTRAMFIYEAAQELGVPVLIHLGSSYASNAPLKFSLPVLIEDIVLEFPDLKLVIARLGYPWTADTMVLIKKHPNVFAEISGLTMKKWQFYNAMVLAMEYGVTSKLIFGSDFPFSTPKRAIEALYSLNQIAQGTSFPTVPRELLRGIVERDALSMLGIEMPVLGESTVKLHRA